MKYLLNLFKTRKTITLTYTNRQLALIKTAVAEGFKAIWNGAVWVLTKIVYL